MLRSAQHDGHVPIEVTRFGYPMLASILALAFILAGPSASFSQGTKSVVKVRMALVTDAVHAGTTARAVAITQIAPGFHIYDHHPSLNYLIPTEMHFTPEENFDVGRIVYPRGKMEPFPFSSTGLSVYEGTVRMQISLKVKAGIDPGEYALRGKLQYQACNDRACFPPTSAPLLLKILVVKPDVQVKPANFPGFANPAPK